MGVSWNEFWNMNPHIIGLIIKGHKEKLRRDDYMAWIHGQYMLSAVWVAVEHNLAGKKAKSKYIKEPLLQKTETEKQKKSKYRESKEEVAIFEMKQRIKALKMQGLPESPE